MQINRPKVQEIKPSSSKWDEEVLFFKGDDYFQAVLSDIKNATESIRFETYIFSNDNLADQFIHELCSAAERGVKVRLTVDGIGSADWNDERRKELIVRGVEFKVFHPVPWKLFRTFKARKFSKFIRLFILRWRLINWRNHRKMIIIDDRLAYVGSMNITADHSYQYAGKNAWRDSAMRVVGHQVKRLAFAFDALWYKGKWQHWGGWKQYKNEHFYSLKKSLVRSNDTLIKRRYFYNNLMVKFKKAKQKIWITTPYFLPNRRQMKLLGQAARRGTDVRILVGRKSDVFFFNWVHPAIFQKLLKQKVKIYEYLPTIIHVKSVTVDQWSIIGSSNFNNRSLNHDLEIDLVITDPRNQQLMELQFKKDLESAELISLETLKKYSFWRMTMGKFLLYFRYWF